MLTLPNHRFCWHFSKTSFEYVILLGCDDASLGNRILTFPAKRSLHLQRSKCPKNVSIRRKRKYIITGQISSRVTRTLPREYYAWWSQGILSVYRLDHNKDICGLASLVLLTQSLQFLYFTIHSQYICVRHLSNCTNQYTSLLSSHFPFNLLTRAIAKSPNPACASFANSTFIKHNSWLIAVSRKRYTCRIYLSQGDKTAVSL